MNFRAVSSRAVVARPSTLLLSRQCFNHLPRHPHRRPLFLVPLSVPRRSSTCSHKEPAHKLVPSLKTLAFWQSPPTWRRAAVNTLRCLAGCSIGDFSVMWYLQTHHADWGMWPAIMALAMASGLASSVALETVLLRLGRDALPSWTLAARTAVGMSFLSMVTMEVVENVVDYWLTGGGTAITFGEPLFWAAAAASMAAGFLAPLPYNYMRLRRFGKACH